MDGTWVKAGTWGGDDVAPWETLWAPENAALEDLASVAVTANLIGASLTEAVDGLLESPGLPLARDEQHSEFTTADGDSGVRVDFTWGKDADNGASAWILEHDGAYYGVQYMRWGAVNDSVRDTIESSIKIVGQE